MKPPILPSDAKLSLLKSIYASSIALTILNCNNIARYLYATKLICNIFNLVNNIIKDFSDACKNENFRKDYTKPKQEKNNNYTKNDNTNNKNNKNKQNKKNIEKAERKSTKAKNNKKKKGKTADNNSSSGIDVDITMENNNNNNNNGDGSKSKSKSENVNKNKIADRNLYMNTELEYCQVG